MTAQKLREIINSKSSIFGSTPNGQDWCIKALHPSDPITEVRGIPDHSAVPSMFMNYQTVTTISPGIGTTGVWQLDGALIPNPLAFGYYRKQDSLGTSYNEFTNSQIPGGTHSERLANFLGDFTRWRLAYASVTIYQDGPDLANQGTVVACQKPVSPLLFTINGGDGSLAPDPGAGYARFFVLQASDLPNYAASQAMPNAYFGKSREGLYLPLKLTHSHQAWHSAQDPVYQSTGSAVTPYTHTTTGGVCQVYNTTASYVQNFPFTELNDLHVNSTSSTLQGTLTSNFCNENWGEFSFRNLAVTTSLSFFFRFGFECQVQPGSMLSPHLKLSPEYDQQAVDTYFRIARELKDAYPADHNDLGKIWDVISGVAKTIAPALSFIPGVGPALSMGVPAAAAMGDRIRGALSRSAKPTVGSTASAADIELARSVPPQVIRTSKPKLAVTAKQLKRARKRMLK